MTRATEPLDSTAEALVPDATLPPQDIDPRYEPLIRHLTDLPAELAPPLGSLQHLVRAVQEDHHAGLTRSLPDDYRQSIEFLRLLRDASQQAMETVAVVSVTSGLSIDRAAEALGVSPNTFRRKLSGKTESLASAPEVDDDDSPF
jgi:hypothetical protein